MSSAQDYTPDELLQFGQRAELEGDTDYAQRVYAYLLEAHADTAEAEVAAVGLERIQLRLKEAANLRPPPPPAAEPSSLGQGFREAGQPPPRTANPEAPGPAPVPPPPHPPHAHPTLSARHEPSQHQPNRQQPDRVPESGRYPPASAPTGNGGTLSQRLEKAAGGAERGVAGASAAPSAPASWMKLEARPHQGPPSHVAPAAASPRGAAKPPAAVPHGAPQQKRNGAQPAVHGSADTDVPLPRMVARAYETDLDQLEAAFRRKYRLGSFLASLFAVLGWFMIVAGFAAGALTVAGVFPAFLAIGWMDLPFGITAAISLIGAGIVFVFVSQLGHAVLDNANASRQILAIEKSKMGY